MSAPAPRPSRTAWQVVWMTSVLLIPFVLVINFVVTGVTGSPDKGYIAGWIFMAVVSFPLVNHLLDGK